MARVMSRCMARVMSRRRKKTVGRRKRIVRARSVKRAPRRKSRRSVRTVSQARAAKAGSELEVRGGAGRKAGSLRTRPSKILWKPRGGRSWYNVRVDSFSKFMAQYGKRGK
jgi:hypothetical protein